MRSFALILLLISTISFAQDSIILKVNAENGLNLRNQPTSNYDKISEELFIENSKKYKIKVTELFNKEFFKVNKTRLSSRELLMIVLPEYITYNKSRDIFEKYLIQLNYFSRKDRFKTISFGPFQMQIDFISKYLDHFPYEDLIRDIDKFSTIKIQWEVLQLFVKNNPNLGIRELINKYNSGNKQLELPFKKLNSNLTYYELSKMLIDINDFGSSGYKNSSSNIQRGSRIP